MVFNDKSAVMEFPLTSFGKDYWQLRRFLTQKELIELMDKWRYNPISGITLSNIVCNQYGPQMKQEVWYRTNEIDRFIGDLMDISLTHGLLLAGNNGERDNYFAVAETAHHTTNITGEFMDILLKKIGESTDWLARHTDTH